MDLLIKNIGGLPKDGDLTLTITPKGEIILGGCIFTHNFGKEVKAIEVPPHGRLGDLDALAEHIRNVYCKNCKRSKVMCKACEYGDILDEIEEAPTVIEASKERE